MFAPVSSDRKRFDTTKNLTNSVVHNAVELHCDVMNGSPSLNSKQNSPVESILQDDEYIMKRQRNNAAVNKTRQKKRQEEMNTQSRVQQLRDENERLERFILNFFRFKKAKKILVVYKKKF